MNYRSPKTKEGAFSQLGSLHVHVDGMADDDQLTELVRKLEGEGFPGKVHKVLQFVEGPQRHAEPGTYAVHTTGFPGREDFASFSTSLLTCRADVRRVIALLLDEVPKKEGVVVELEQVCARVNPDGTWEEEGLHHVAELSPDEVPLTPQPTLPVEIHHMIDVPIHFAGQEPGEESIDLKSLLTDEQGGSPIPYGGWFLFRKKGARAYRSNSFSGLKGVRKKVLREHTRLAKHQALTGLKGATQRTLVERVLGVWRI